MSKKTIPCSWCRASLRANAKTCASCGAPRSQKPRADTVTFARALSPGTRLRGGDYEIQNVIGQGRFGITYRALNHRLNRVVAIKEWFPSTCERDGLQVLAGPHLGAREFEKGRAAFLEEARVLARFEHPAIVSLFAVWEENRSAYMEMELLHGPTLAQVLERFHHLKTDDALRLFAPILDALQQLHAQNWLHRDLNPHNIVLRGAAFEAADAATCVQNSRAVLIDFGAARQIAPDISQEFSVLVTPGYAPLEQYAVRARRGAYSDIYALCATLYHALSGQIPPPAPDRANGALLVPLRDLAPAVPQQFCHAIESGLETEIARRPQTVGDLQKLLPPLPVQVLAQVPMQVLAPPVAFVAPVEKAPQVLAAPLAWPQSADDARTTANSATDKRTRNMLWAMGLGPFAFALLMGVLIPRPSVEPHWSVPATRLIDEPPFRTPTTPHPTSAPCLPPSAPTPFYEKIAQAVFSPSGLLAGIDNQQDKSTIRLWDTQSGRILHSLGTVSPESRTDLMFSPDESLLAIRESATVETNLAVQSRDKYSLADEKMQSRLRVVEMSNGKTLWQRTMSASSLRWSRKGSEIITQISNEEVAGCDARSGKNFSIHQKGAFGTPSDDAQWFADYIAYQGQEISVRRLKKTTGWKWKLDSDESSGYFRFAPDNSWIMSLGAYGVDKTDKRMSYTSYTGGRARFYDLKTGKLINVWSGKPEDDSGAGFSPFFSPRGRYVGIKRFDNVLRVWEVRTHRDFAFRWPALPTTIRIVPHAAKPENSLQFDWQSSEFSPDENQIVMAGASRNLRLVDLSARTIRQAQLPLKVLKSPEEATAIRPSSPIKASFTADNRHIIWLNPQTGQMGRLSVDDFNQKVPVEIIDGATSQPS